MYFNSSLLFEQLVCILFKQMLLKPTRMLYLWGTARRRLTRIKALESIQYSYSFVLSFDGDISE